MHKVGGGAAGMRAAIQSARKGNQVLLLEKNERLGKKLFITGKGRCNVTNGCDVEELFGKVTGIVITHNRSDLLNLQSGMLQEGGCLCSSFPVNEINKWQPHAFAKFGR